jgi:serine/threonine protein kinase
MRFIEGPTLAEAIQDFHRADQQPGRDQTERALALRQLLGHFVAVCNTVAYAHSHGVVHRDLKPANVLLGRYGETLVVDWGLAKVMDPTAPGGAGPGASGDPTGSTAAQGATQSGQVKGTPEFMSPEQASGNVTQVGPPADVFALGALLYAILAGRPPYQGDVFQVLVKAVLGEFLPPRRVKPGVPPALEAVCLKAMAPQPGARYAGALELKAEVERWLADEPVHAYREPWPARLARWGRRHRAWVIGAAALLLTAVLGLAAGIVAVNRERQETEAERDQKEQALKTEARRRQQARGALDAMSFPIIDDWLARQPELLPEHRSFLQKALASYEEFA